jgi:hypothetical protein
VVLEGHPGFANQLLTAVGLDPVAQVEVSTEVRTPAGRRVDMELLGLDERGSAVVRLWSEHKTGAEYQPEQLPDYLRSLSTYREQNKLITIVPEQRDAAPAGSGSWEGSYLVAGCGACLGSRKGRTRPRLAPACA